MISRKKVIRVIEINIEMTMPVKAYMIIKESLNMCPKVKKNIQEANITTCPVLTCSRSQVWNLMKRRLARERGKEMLLKTDLLPNIQSY